MATNATPALNRRLLYVAWQKQAAWNTAVNMASANYWRWRQGTKETPAHQYTDEKEGDTAAWETLSTKETIYRKFTVVEAVRPITAGCAIAAFCGTGSDTLTAPAKSTTLSAPVAVGATQIVTVGDLTNVGSLGVSLEGGYSSSTNETVTLDLTTRTGTGPWTYTLAGGAKCAFAHSAAGTVTSVIQHAIAPTLYAFDPYTVEFGYGNAAVTTLGPTRALRLRDAVCYGLKLSGTRGGKYLMLQSDWWAAVSAVQASGSFLTPAYEGGTTSQNTGGNASSPFAFAQALGNWQLDGATTGHAAAIEQFSISLQRGGAKTEDFINESLTPNFFMAGDISVSGSLLVQFQTFQQLDEAIYGVASAGTNAADAIAFLTGQFSTSFALDAINSFGFSIPRARWAAPALHMNPQAGPVKLPLSFKALWPSWSTAPISFTLKNSYNTAY